MDQALWIAKTGLEAQQTRMAVTANNLANVNTTGFKRSRAVFEDLLYQNDAQAGAQSSESTELNSGLMLGTGVRVVATEKMFNQGNLVQTGNSLDMAIEGRGFFQILMPDGDIGYTRDGTFQVNANGEVVTSKGYSLQPSITIPEDALSVTISKDGIVSVTQPGVATPVQVGTIETHRLVTLGVISGDRSKYPAGDVHYGNGGFHRFRQDKSDGGLLAEGIGLILLEHKSIRL